MKTHGRVAAAAVAVCPWWEREVLPDLTTLEVIGIILFLACLVGVHVRGVAACRKALATRLPRTLSMPALHEVLLTKEVFMAYLGSALLEPLIAIVGSERISGRELLVNLSQLAGLLWWTHLLLDAFDASDVVQSFTYAKFRREAASAAGGAGVGWLRVGVNHAAERVDERQDLEGKLSRDVALWFVLSCIVAAMCGVVTHRDVAHSYIVAIFWTVLHHQARRATAWSASYPVTLFSPSAALMPLECVIPLSTVCSLADLAAWRDFIAESSGVDLVIES